MSNYDFDISVLQEEFTRVTVDKKPGAPKKFGNFLDKIVKLPKSDGYVTIRLLPALPDHLLPYAPCRVHNLATFEERQEKKAKNLYCGRNLVNKQWVGDCFFCEYYSHLYKCADKAEKEGNDDLCLQYKMKAKAIKPQEKYYYNGIVFDSHPNTGQSPEDGPLIFSCGIQLHTRILEACCGNKAMKKASKGIVWHPKSGRNLKVVKVMKPGGDYPDYSGTEWEDISPLSEDDAQIDKWLAAMNDVYSIRKILSTEDMKKALRVFEGVEVDTRKSFDASFLDKDSAGTTCSVAVPESKVSHVSHVESVAVATAIPDIEDDDLVDDELANSIRAAIKQAD